MKRFRLRFAVPGLVLGLLSATFTGAGSGQATGTGPGTALSGGITFDHASIVDPFRLVGEPDIAIDHHGGIYTSGPAGSAKQTSFFWKSDDGGAQWHSIGVIPEAKPNGTNGGGDTEYTIDNNDNVFASDLQTLVCQGTYRSMDQGKTFTQGEGCVPGTDRQWMGNYTAPDGSERIYLASNGQLVGCYMLVSTNQGLTYTPTGSDPSNLGSITGDDCAGRFVVDQRNGNIFVPLSGGAIVESTDGGNTWKQVGDTGAKENLFAPLAQDSAGNLYQAWTDTKNTYLSVSTDGGQNWTQYQMNGADIRQEVFPWVVAGDAGRVAVVFYGTSDTGKTGGWPGTAKAVWRTYSVFSTDADTAAPHFQLLPVDEHPMHLGPVCLGGFPGCLLNNADRSLADFFEVGMDPRDGRVFVVYNDNADRDSTNNIGKSYVMVARERTGPSLLADHPDFTTTSADVAIGSADVSGGTVALSGTDGLPAGDWTTDPAGDAIYPVAPAAAPNNPALDITSASAGDDGKGNLSFTLNLASLTDQTLAQAFQGGGVPAWVFTWDYGNAHYFVRGVATPVDCGSLPCINWTYGKVGDVEWPALGAPAPAYLTYPPSGTAEGHLTSDNLVQVTVPASAVGSPPAGAKLDTITAYTWSEKGPIPSVVDQAPAFSYVVGTPAAGQHAPDGYVQVSVDDPTFANPVTAALSGSSDWSASLSGLATGTHTIYVRQVLSSALYNPGVWDDVVAGPVASVEVTV